MARRPVRRRTITARRGRRGRRARRARDQAVLLGTGALAAFSLATVAVQWLAHHLLALTGIIVVALGAAAAVVRARAAADRRAHHARTAQLRRIGAFTAMSPKAFEHALADLCRRDGCTKVTVVGGSGDLAADVLATTPAGQRILIQAKRYSPGSLVGSQDVQKVNGTYRDIHGCDLAAVVTTSTFTKAAAAFCTRVGIRMTDHRALALWAEGTGRPPWH
ncbi:restriction endonuclease [Kitasatospora sp. NPDC056327]|uniref:restriction endonuclease n=1 Tax=Kitasatospora sp. NPDC056327 TaxID=3345785 RepID=UPI0035DC5957